MEVLGERKCAACGTRWSYYETGSVECPHCGSVRSTAAGDERREHTDHAPDITLDDAVRAAADGDYREAARRARDPLREYTRKRGFLDGGALRELDDTALAAWELRYVAADFARTAARGDDARDDAVSHFFALLRGVPDGERPRVADVPTVLRPARGNGVADAVDAYRGDVRRHLDGGPDRDGAAPLLEALDDHVRRVHALDGDVPPEAAEALVAAARAVGRYARDGDDGDREAAHECLDDLA